MKKVKKCWMVVLGAALMAILVGVAGARPNDSGMAAVSRRITLDAAFFTACDEENEWYQIGEYIASEVDGSAQHFAAPVVFPTGQAVVVESLTLYAFDNNGSENVCVEMEKTDPSSGSLVQMANVCSTGSSSTDPRSFTTSSISDNPVKHGKGIHLHLQFDDDTDLKFYGVQIQYYNGTT